MNEERFWLLVSLKLSGEAEPEEIKELESLLQQYPEMGLKTGMLETIWQTPAHALTENKEAPFNRHMQRLSNHFSEPVLQYEEEEMAAPAKSPGPIRSVYKRIFWAAGIAASLVVAWFVFGDSFTAKETSPKTIAQNTVSTKRGSKSKIQLPDGTQVWLNADSKITYKENFQGTKREVQLSGEAFFDVVRDESRPFVIHTNAIDVKVLGTTFNVRSYEDEDNTETSLIHGSVEVTLRNDPDKKIVLKPNQKLIVNNNEALLVHKEKDDKANAPLMTLSKIRYQQEDSTVTETSWVKNKLVFDSESLEDIALKIERWYDVKVTIRDESLKGKTYTSTFSDESLQVVMEALHIAGKFKYEINKKEVTIWR